jgi:hypothetical protein
LAERDTGAGSPRVGLGGGTSQRDVLQKVGHAPAIDRIFG